MRCISTITVIIIASIGTCHAEYFSSMDILQTLGDIEAKLINISRAYIEQQEKEYRRYESFVEHVKLQHSRAAAENVEDYVGNPVNAFKLIKRIVIDWNNLHNLVKQSPALKTFVAEMEGLKKEKELPNNDDLVGAAKGIDRLQSFYDIDAKEFAGGVIKNVAYGHTLSWHDCYDIAVNLYDTKLYNRSIEWFQLALAKLTEFQEERIENIEVSVYEHLALAHYELADIENKLKYIDNVLKLLPEHPIRATKIFVQHNANTKQPRIQNNKFHWWANYTRLCRGHVVADGSKHNLKCYLDSQHDAVFQLAPLKVEQLHLEPDILLYHQLLNDEQIEKIIAEAGNNLQRSSIIKQQPGYVSDVRNSQQAWLTYDSPMMASVHRLVQKIVGLNFHTDNRELMQMANYGIGGQYDCHHDYFGPSFRSPQFHGDRMATNMFYLNNVEQGGYTVFPFLNTFSAPVKGTLIVWFNLLKSLAEDVRTVHCGCPVLKGSKRIGNIWVHSGMQEFRRPCELFDDKSKADGYVYEL